MGSLLLKSRICLRPGDQPRLSGQERKSVCYSTPMLFELTSSIPIRSNVPHFHLSIIWYGARMAPFRIYRSDCILPALESMAI